METMLQTAELPFQKPTELPVETKEMVPDILDRMEVQRVGILLSVSVVCHLTQPAFSGFFALAPGYGGQIQY